MVEKVMIKMACRVARLIRKVRFRWVGSVFMKFWLARAIKGSIQQDKTNKGEEMVSVPSCWFILE